MKKVLFLMIILFILSGCKAKYEIDIKNDLSVYENISGLEDDKFYNLFDSSKSDVVKLVIAPYKDIINSDYAFKEFKDGNLFGAKVSKKYDSLDSYYDSFGFYKVYFKDLEIKKEKNIVSISLTSKKNNDLLSNRYVIDSGEIIISLPFKVSKHNADKVSGNKYIWNFDLTDKTKSDIYIEFDSKNNISMKKNNYIIFGGFILLILVASFIVYKYYKFAQDTRNKI